MPAAMMVMLGLRRLRRRRHHAAGNDRGRHEFEEPGHGHILHFRPDAPTPCVKRNRFADSTEGQRKSLRYCHQHSRCGVITWPLGLFSTASQARQ